MDTVDWLDEQFALTDVNGTYRAHQPIYGFREKPCDFGYVNRYVITYHIMKALARLKVRSLLDIGAAEGYKAALARDTFGLEVACSDVSAEACNRAREIYGIHSVPADARRLPFDSDSFDVTICSEVLEHIDRYEEAVSEILRVSRVAAVFTVPHEPATKTEHNRASGSPHAHINSFELDTFDKLCGSKCLVEAQKICSPLLLLPGVIVDATPIEHADRYRFPRFVTETYNALTPMFRALFGERTASCLVRADSKLSTIFPWFSGIIYIVVKQPFSLSQQTDDRIRPRTVIDYRVAKYKLRKVATSAPSPNPSS